MLPEFVILAIIIVIAALLFATGLIRMDLTALFVLVALALTGLVSPAQALSGFSSPAVVILWAMFILSAGFNRTGISNLIGARLLKLAGKSESRLIAFLMGISAFLSAIMNNVGVAAMFLPITLDIARRTRRPASRLLLPMAYGALHGSMMPLIGTSAILIVREVMIEANLTPLNFLDFAPGGLIILIISIAYMLFIGRRFLPFRQAPKALSAADTINEGFAQNQYALQERLAMLIIQDGNPLAGKSLTESRIGQALGLTVLSIKRKDGEIIQATADAIIKADDQLLVLGRLDRINELCQRPLFVIDDIRPIAEQLVSEGITMAELLITPESPFAKRTLNEIDFRNKYRINVLGIQQSDIIKRTNLQHIALMPGDQVLIEGPQDSIDRFCQHPGFCQLEHKNLSKYLLDERLLSLHIPEGSSLIEKTLQESRFGSAYGISVLRVIRDGAEAYLPDHEFRLQANDVLIVEGRPSDIDTFRGLQLLQVVPNVEVDLEELTSGSLQMVEVMLSPTSKLAGKTLRDAHFRGKYNVTVLAIWRRDRAYRSGLGELTLQHGDALLCFGTVENLKIMARESDFVVLKMDLQEPPLYNKAPQTALIMAGVVLSVVFFNVPIAISAIAGGALMVLFGALSMENAYESVDWSSVFLLAAMLPMGLAIQETGAAGMVSRWLVSLIGGLGPSWVLAGLMALVILGKLVMPSTVIAVFMAPIALSVAFELGISPYAFMVGISYALAASFISPLAHPITLMVMTPGSYRFSDYIKHGLPISLIVILVSVLLLPLLFPYY
ncbi:MAG TPA: SLC13 family permease [Brevefilum sp.]|nr:SLC13 family permease [Brevefilum sp.]HOR19621.1 SLC13 family permease [Brevefilum sp.]HPL70233.1 SLC13 family permease [Brevefilum sp.]